MFVLLVTGSAPAPCIVLMTRTHEPPDDGHPQANHHRGKRTLRLDRVSSAAGDPPADDVALGLSLSLSDKTGMESLGGHGDGQPGASRAVRTLVPAQRALSFLGPLHLWLLFP